MTEENVEIEQFPSNSQSQKKEEPEDPSKRTIRQVTSAKRIVRKKSFLDTFLNGTLKVVGGYILFEILIPATKNMISDMINNGSDMILFGEPKSRRRDRDRGLRGSFINYTSYSDRDRDRPSYYDRDRERRDNKVYGRSKFDSDDILLPTREDAEDVIQEMFLIYDQYNAVTVAEFLEIVGLPDEFTDHNYGWTNLRDVQTRRVRDGYIIDLPTPRPLPR